MTTGLNRLLFVAFVDWKNSSTVPPIVVTKDPLEWIGDPQLVMVVMQLVSGAVVPAFGETRVP